MDYNNVLEGLVGTSPFVAFLIWYILSEKKVKQDDKEYCREKQDEYNDSMQEIIKDNQKIIIGNTQVMKALGEKYEELKDIVTEGFAETNKDIKDLYRKVSNNENN